MPADAAQARLAGVLDGAAELVDVAVALRVLRQLDRVGAAAGQVDELDRDVVGRGLVAHAGERLDLHVVDAHVDVADAEALFFVYDDESQIIKLDVFLQQSVGADHNIYAPIL